MKLNKKILTAILAVVLLTVVVSGTLAYFTDTDEGANTFTMGKVDITLEETTGDEYTMTPGVTMAKDPVVTVQKGSEDCWVFVEAIESDNLDSFISYTVDSAKWTQLEENVYYCQAKNVTADLAINILQDDQVSVLPSVTKEMMAAIKADPTAQPTLEFKAYAIQMEGIDTAADAWTNLHS